MFCGQKMQQNLHQNTSIPHISHGILPSLSSLPTDFRIYSTMRSTTIKVQVSIGSSPLRVSALQDTLPERLCACHAAQLPQSIPHGHSNQEHGGTDFLILLWEHWRMSLGWELLLQGGWKQGLWVGDPLAKWELLHRPQGTSLQTSAASVLGLTSHSHLQNWLWWVSMNSWLGKEQGIIKRKGKTRHSLWRAPKKSGKPWSPQALPGESCRVTPGLAAVSLCCLSVPGSTGALEPEISSATTPQLEPELALLNTASLLSWELEWAVLDCTAKQFKQMTNLNPSVRSYFGLWKNGWKTSTLSAHPL